MTKVINKPRNRSGKHPNSLKNLKKIQPGQVLNPKGRPKKIESLTTALKELMESVDEVSGLTEAQLLAKATLKLAKKGNGMALKEIWDRVAGKQAQAIDASVTNKLSIELIKEIREDAGLESKHLIDE